MSQAGITLDAAFRATHSAQATWPLASVQVESTWISLLMNNLTLSTVSMPNSMVFFAWCLLDSIYCISWYTSTSLMNWAAPYFCQHSHKCTKNVRPVVGVSLAGTTLDAAFRATHPAQATCARASEQLDSTWIWLLVNSLTISTVRMHHNTIYFCILLSR